MRRIDVASVVMFEASGAALGREGAEELSADGGRERLAEGSEAVFRASLSDKRRQHASQGVLGVDPRMQGKGLDFRTCA